MTITNDSKPLSQSPLDILRRNRSSLVEALDGVQMAANVEARELHASEKRKIARAQDELDKIDARIDQLEAKEQREAVAASSRVELGQTSQAAGLQRGYHTGGGETYHRGNQAEVSFFRDLYSSSRGDWDAMQRLSRNAKEVAYEKRALSTTAGAGGEFAPPLWMVDEFVALARPGRVTADLFHKEPLPTGVASVNLPKVATGTTTAVQSTQNSALSQTDLTSSSLSSGITMIGGKQVTSLQLLMQSGVPFDRIILEDLAADYAKQLGLQVLTGSGTAGQLKGYLTPSSTNVVTWTQASPTVALFYSQLAKLQSQINATRYRQPDTVVMHPRRWAWFASGVDSQNRPLVVPNTNQQSFNTMAANTAQLASGHVGNVLGMDVYTDPNIPTNLGAGTNQDIVLMFPRDDIWFWEGDFMAETFNATYADSAGVLFRLLNFSAMIPDRYLASLGQITGTGLISPTFPG